MPDIWQVWSSGECEGDVAAYGGGEVKEQKLRLCCLHEETGRR